MEGKITVFIYSTALTSVRIETFRSNQEENVTIWFPMLVVRHESLNTAPAGGGGGGHSASPAPNHPKDHQQELISGTVCVLQRMCTEPLNDRLIY